MDLIWNYNEHQGQCKYNPQYFKQQIPTAQSILP